MASPTVQRFASGLAIDRTVSVEGHDKTYKVPRSILLESSPWFVSALSERFQEGTDLVLRFPDTSADVVECFLYFLFHGTVPFEELPAFEEHDTDHDRANHYRLAIELWVFSDEHLLPKLQNLAIRHVHRSIGRWLMDQEMLPMALRASPVGSSMRRLLITELAHEVCGWEESEDPTDKAGYDPDKLDLLEGIPGVMAELTRKMVLVQNEECDWNEWHEKGVDAYLVNEDPESTRTRDRTTAKSEVF